MNIWEVILWIGIPGAILVLLVWTFLIWRSAREKRKTTEAQAPYLDWARAVLAAPNHEAVLAVVQERDSEYEYGDYRGVRSQDLHVRARERLQAARHYKSSQDLAVQLKNADDVNFVQGIVEVDRRHLDSVVALGMHEHGIKDFFLGFMHETLLKARAGSEDQLLGYIALLNDYYVGEFIKKHDLTEAVVPNDWNALVANTFDYPNLEYFHNLKKHSPREVLRMAVQTIVHADNFDADTAKLVLAYYLDGGEEYRRAVGDALYGELAKLIHLHKS